MGITVVSIEVYENKDFFNVRRPKIDNVRRIDSLQINVRKGYFGYGIIEGYSFVKTE